MRWAGHVARMGERRDVYSFFGEETLGKDLFGRSRHRWENDIKIGSSGSGMWEYGLCRAGSG